MSRLDWEMDEVSMFETLRSVPRYGMNEMAVYCMRFAVPELGIILWRSAARGNLVTKRAELRDDVTGYSGETTCTLSIRRGKRTPSDDSVSSSRHSRFCQSFS